MRLVFNLMERRPDLVAYYWELRRIVIYEVACAWEPLIEEWQREKRGKYRELAAVVGDLCSYLPENLNAQFEVLFSTVRILQRHLSNDAR